MPTTASISKGALVEETRRMMMNMIAAFSSMSIEGNRTTVVECLERKEASRPIIAVIGCLSTGKMKISQAILEVNRLHQNLRIPST